MKSFQLAWVPVLSVLSIGLILLPAASTGSGSHSVTAVPTGGLYNSNQTVTLLSSEPSSIIYYSTDGGLPDSNSTIFDGTPLDIVSNVTLKFFSIDPANNHSSTIESEVYVIDRSVPIAIAVPVGGTYDSAQNVILESNEPSAIFYSLDGSVPTNSSSQFISAITIANQTTLKFIAIDNAGNPSLVYTENYDFSPSVTAVQPTDGSRRVSANAVINATFTKAMNPDTINSDTFTVTDETDELILGVITYDSITMTASFTSEDPLALGGEFTANLTDGIEDDAGNPIPVHTWTFTVSGRIIISVRDVENFTFINGSGFTITPNPFTLEDSLVIQDNDSHDSDVALFGSQRNGIIVVDDVENSFVTYDITETTVPVGYSRIWNHNLVTVTQRSHCESCNSISSTVFDNRRTLAPISNIGAVISIPAPFLNQIQFELYEDDVIVGRFLGIQGQIPDPASPIKNPRSNSLPSAFFATSETIGELPLLQSMIFIPSASPNLAGPEIFELFEIPSYPAPEVDIADEVIYVVPAAVIPYEDAKNNFILTPVIEKVFPSMNLILNQSSFVESKLAKVEQVNMTFSVEAENVGFSFGVSDTPPPGTPLPPLDATALFLDIGFVGDTDFSDPSAFESSPKIDILVNKTLSGFDQLPDGCVDFVMLFFDDDLDQWREVQQLRNPTLDTGAESPEDPSDDQCGFTLEPEHFSKFAVGGVKGQTIQTEQERDSSGGGGGGGRSRSTAITQTPTGADVETSITTESGIVLIIFESVEAGSGQIKIDANELSVFAEFFDTLAFLSQDDNEHGTARIDGRLYATAGDVFDIDASAVMFSGKVDVTIPYSEETVMQFGTESNVKFIHFNEELGVWEDVTGSVDENANTVTGTLESLSPVAAAIILERGSIEVDTTYVQVRSPEFAVSSGSVLMSANLKNMRASNQEYVMVAQIVDARGIAQHIDWQAGTLDGGQETDVGMTWQDLAEGTYQIKIIVMTNLDVPWFLADPVDGQFDV